jgi:hypothetical protein
MPSFCLGLRVENLVQECFLRAYLDLDRLRDRERFETDDNGSVRFISRQSVAKRRDVTVLLDLQRACIAQRYPAAQT